MLLDLNKALLHGITPQQYIDGLQEFKILIYREKGKSIYFYCVYLIL